MIGFLASAVGLYLLFVAALYVFQRGMLYHPDSSLPDLKASGIQGMSSVSARTEDGLTVTSWYSPPRSEDLPTLVYLHGNAGNVGSRTDKVSPYIEAGFGVMLVGYRGYGGNPGKPTETGLYADARAALSFLESEGAPSENIVLYGESLGTAVAVKMASERAAQGGVAALILEAPFTSIVDAAAHFYPIVPTSLLLKDRYDSARIIDSVSTPVFVIHGELDTTMPIKFARRLFEKAIEPKESLWFSAAGHNNLYDFGAAKEVLTFLKRYTDFSVSPKR